MAGPLDPKTLYSADAIKAFAEEKDVVIVGFLKVELNIYFVISCHSVIKFFKIFYSAETSIYLII